MNVLLSIKPQFAYKIFNGEKKYEYRRSIFKRRDIHKIIVYASAPVKRIIGEMSMEYIFCDHPEIIWEETKKYSGVEKDGFFNYFKGKVFGFAIKIKSAHLYREPVDPKSIIKNFRPPQNFKYLQKNIFI